ncbi:hypothetical protein Pla22_46200 [Rubripirellula amarantea]|uniref:Uncharacterized protein n=1 Tax=Rubripirellula amarantea TaxID=2527999 RepID=A0A5C5WF84_9BACT|nr:hypothetical protein Pla22_46200 [Rubripirellula amarantea]
MFLKEVSKWIYAVLANGVNTVSMSAGLCNCGGHPHSLRQLSL